MHPFDDNRIAKRTSSQWIVTDINIGFSRLMNERFTELNRIKRELLDEVGD